MSYTMMHPYTYCIIATYDGTPFLCSFFICLYDTYYAAGLVIERFAIALTYSRIILFTQLEVLCPSGGQITDVMSRVKQDT